MVVDDQQPGPGRCGDCDRSALAPGVCVSSRSALAARLLGRERRRDARTQTLAAGDLDRAPISSISWREMARPRPVPRSGDWSRIGPAEKARTVAPAFRGLMPMPLSCTLQAEFLASFARRQCLHLQGDRAGVSELDRIADQVGENLAQPRRVEKVCRPERRIHAPRKKEPLAAGHMLEGGDHAVDQARYGAGGCGWISSCRPRSWRNPGYRRSARGASGSIRAPQTAFRAGRSSACCRRTAPACR